MPILLPSVKPHLSQNALDSLSPVERLSAFYGVNRQFLHFASEAYLNDPEEQYGVHDFSTLRISGESGYSEVTYENQHKHARELLDSGHLWNEPSGLIILNAPNFLFYEAADKLDTGALAFLNHLLCSLSYRVVNRKCPPVDVHFLETMQLDMSRDYQFKERHLLIWGPVTDYFSNAEFSKAIQFLYTFRHFTRILVMSTKDVGEMLDKLRIRRNYISYIFQFDFANDRVVQQESSTKQRKKKTRRSSPTTVSL